jgi:hypothetical protein
MTDVPTFALRRLDTAMQAAWLLGAWAWAMTMYVGTEALPWGIAAGAAILLPLMSLGQRLYQVRLEPENLVIHRTWGRAVRCRYEQITSVEMFGGLFGRSLRVCIGKGPYVTIPGNVEGLDELAALLRRRAPAVESTGGTPDAGIDPGAPSGSAAGRAAAVFGGLLIAAWTGLWVVGLYTLTTTGRFDLLLAGFAAGFAAPGLAYVFARGRSGPLGACFPACQLCLWLCGPALAWAFTATVTTSAFGLLAWLTAAYGIGAAVSTLLPTPPADRPRGRLSLAGWVMALLSAAAPVMWALLARQSSLPVEFRGAFAVPKDLRAEDGAMLPVISQPRRGRWLTMTGARQGKALIARLAVAAAGEPIFDDWTFHAAGRPLGVAWSPDGSAAAVLFGEGSRDLESMRVAAVETVWWMDPTPIRTLRVFRTTVLMRSLVWSPDGGQMRIHVGREDGEGRSEPPRVYRFLAGGDSAEPEMTLEEDDVRLRAVRPDGRLVFDRTDAKGNWFALIRSPVDYRDPDAPVPRKPVGPAAPDARVERFRLPVVGRRIADSPNGRYLVLRAAGGKSAAVYDFHDGSHFEIADPTDGAALPELPFGAEPICYWSGDGATLLIPPPTPSATPGTAVAFHLASRTSRRIDVPVAGAVSAWSLSNDGTRAAALVEAGSIAAFAASAQGPTPEAPPTASSAPAPAPGRASGVEFTEARRAREQLRPLPLQRAVLVIDIAAGEVRCLPILPAGLGLRPEGSPTFLWPDDEEALYVVLRRPRPMDETLRLFRAALKSRE